MKEETLKEKQSLVFNSDTHFRQGVLESKMTLKSQNEQQPKTYQSL